LTPELEILRQNETFQTVMREVRKERPEIPLHNHETENTPDNTEEWKALSNQRRGFELALSYFGEYYE